LKTSRDRLTLDEAMHYIGAAEFRAAHMVYDHNVRPQYRIRRASTHDGTLCFSTDLMREALRNLAMQTSYFKPMGEAPHGYAPRYTIGRIKRFSVYGRVSVGCGEISGERECVSIPVRCDYVPIRSAE
jgi:hypothetical protein